MELQSEKIDALAKALSVAQGAIGAAQKDGNNPHFKSKYATLDSIWDACRVPLSANGLAVVQIPLSDEAGFSLITTLCHESGQWMKSVLRVDLASNTAQGVGSALTYMRRYALAAMVGVAPADDDDGESASGRPLNIARRSEPAPAPPAPGPAARSTANGDTPKTNGNTINAASGQELLDLVNKRVEVPYDNVFHLQNALKVEIPNFTWPKTKTGWQDAYEAAVKHANAKLAPQEPAGDDLDEINELFPGSE